MTSIACLTKQIGQADVGLQKIFNSLTALVQEQQSAEKPKSLASLGALYRHLNKRSILLINKFVNVLADCSSRIANVQIHSLKRKKDLRTKSESGNELKQDLDRVTANR